MGRELRSVARRANGAQERRVRWPPVEFSNGLWEALGRSLLEGRIDIEEGQRFVGRNLAGARFRDVSLAGAHFDDINFAGADITARCNFRGMRIGGVLVDELFAAYRRVKAGDGEQG
jgi:uncharacterized protein YjbI with pentapeptide repeats